MLNKQQAGENDDDEFLNDLSDLLSPVNEDVLQRAVAELDASSTGGFTDLHVYDLMSQSGDAEFILQDIPPIRSTPRTPKKQQKKKKIISIQMNSVKNNVFKSRVNIMGHEESTQKFTFDSPPIVSKFWNSVN